MWPSFDSDSSTKATENSGAAHELTKSNTHHDDRVIITYINVIYCYIIIVCTEKGPSCLSRSSEIF